MSASASAVSVLPTPDGPANRNTPRGLFGSSRLAEAVRTRWAMACSAWSWPITRAASSGLRLSTVRSSSLTMRPSGIPVQAETISDTTWPSTCSGTMGVSPCSARSSASNAASSSGESGAAAARPRLAGIATTSLLAAIGSASCPPACAAPPSRASRSAWMRATRARSWARRSVFCAMRCSSSVRLVCSASRRASCAAPALCSRCSAAISPSRRSSAF